MEVSWELRDSVGSYCLSSCHWVSNRQNSRVFIWEGLIAICISQSLQTQVLFSEKADTWSPSFWLLVSQLLSIFGLKLGFYLLILSNPNKNSGTLRGYILTMADDVVHISSLTKRDKKRYTEFVLRLVWRNRSAIHTMKIRGARVCERGKNIWVCFSNWVIADSQKELSRAFERLTELEKKYIIQGSPWKLVEERVSEGRNESEMYQQSQRSKPSFEWFQFLIGLM